MQWSDARRRIICQQLQAPCLNRGYTFSAQYTMLVSCQPNGVQNLLEHLLQVAAPFPYGRGFCNHHIFFGVSQSMGTAGILETV